ncbi:RNA polymerase II [Obelidium mucronatum]|nr:RNA polymerase II [Obelidium mucronatum]
MAVDSKPQLLSNAEVLEFLRTCDVQDHLTNNNSQHLRTVTFEVTRYLTNQVTASPLSSAQSLALANKLKPMGLMKAEVLMILNNCPSSHVELYLMIEELGDRFNEEQVEEMLAIIQEHVQAATGGPTDMTE